MSKCKPFRRVKVSNRGYCAGYRQQFKVHPKSQTFGNLIEGTPPGTICEFRPTANIKRDGEQGEIRDFGGPKKAAPSTGAAFGEDMEMSPIFYHERGREAMTNEELVALIQTGERERMPELWEQVERFVSMQAGKRARALEGYGGVTQEDLYQSGYLALVAAVDSFNPSAGRSFISWLALALKTAFSEAGGYRSRKQSLDPLHRAGSLDIQVGEDEGSATLGELQADPGAERAFEDAEHQADNDRLHTALVAAIATLPPDLRSVIRDRYYRG